MTFNTFYKGHVGLTKIIADLTEKEWSVFIPVTDQTAVDLIAEKNGEILRIQCKYCSPTENSILIRNKSGYFAQEKTIRKYNENEFDIYGVYIPNLDKVIYTTFDLGGKRISIKLPKTNIAFYWWEDFKEPKKNNIYELKNLNDFMDYDSQLSESTLKTMNGNCVDCGISICATKSTTRCSKCCRVKTSKQNQQKFSVEKEQLQILLWEKPTTEIAKQFQVSDSAIAKRARLLGCSKPPRGYWSMKEEDKALIKR